MFRPIFCLILLTASLGALNPLSAQIHEDEPPADLGKSLVFKTAAAQKDTVLAPAAETQAGLQSFSLGMLVEFATPLTETILAQQSDDKQGWRFVVTTDGALRFEARTSAKPDASTVSTLPGVIAPGSRHHVVINILRDAVKPNGGIWVDGVELTSGVVPPVNLATEEPLRTVAARSVRLYHRELTRPEVLALQLEATGGAERSVVGKQGGGKFNLKAGETIALIGGTEAAALAESGELEAMLLATHPQTRFHFRCLAWEGDTVFRQDRPLNFGDLNQQLARLNASTVFVMFGRQECLERGMEGAKEFGARLAALLTELGRRQTSVVVIGPAPYEEKAAPLPDLNLKNASLRAEYYGVLEAVASRHGAVFADVIEHWPAIAKVKRGAPAEPWTTDGVTLTGSGLQRLAQAVGKSLNLRGESGSEPEISAVTARLLPEVRAKNDLWHAYWRPTNWAFLHGDRTQQPSSRDADNPQLRFFPSEQEKYLPLLKKAEDKIFTLATELASKKLP